MLKRKHSRNGQLKNTKHKLHVIKIIFTIFLPTKLKNLNAITPKAGKKLKIPVEPAMQCVTQVRIPTAKTPTQKGKVSKVYGRRPLISSEGRLSLTKANKSVRIPNVYSSRSAKSFARRSRCRSRIPFMASLYSFASLEIEPAWRQCH